ncbi:MAG: hypothetical protein EXR27_16545 [Betaproteobacteria bacterium]|nr:hypothetical protein [Betaproteobacteria bacterium]
MKRLRYGLVLAALAVVPAQAAEQDDWAMFGRILSLAQGFARISAAGANDPARVEAHVDHLFSGGNTDANELVAEIFSEMPAAQRGQVLSLARQVVVLGQRQAREERRQADEQLALQARKNLAGMGLSYFDRRQFLDAVGRNDLLAVRQYVLGRGVDPGGAMELAQSAGFREIAQLLGQAGAK